jgi:hypothetical protein
MTLTKLAAFIPGTYEYVNLDHLVSVAADGDHYDVLLSDGTLLCIDVDDTTISGLVSAADAAYGP